MRQGGQRVLGTLSRAQFSSGEEAAERLCCLQEQAELKLRASELRAKEDQLAAEREALEQERRELRLEKERVSAAAQRIRLRAEEVESMSQVPSGSAPGHGQCTHPASPADPGGLPAGGLAEVYEEGERALREARQVQAEQQARLQLVQRQQEQLRQQERHVHQARLFLPPAPPAPGAFLPPPLPPAFCPHSCVLSGGTGTGESESGPAAAAAGSYPTGPALRARGAALQGPGLGSLWSEW